MKDMLKRLAARLPEQWQQNLKRFYFGRKIRSGHFLTDEPEYALLPTILAEGDWVIDVGANVGHYTLRCSQLVGQRGRVVAIEPVPVSFELLSANAARSPFTNITLINTAASDSSCVLGMTIPRFATGLTDYYRAQLSETEQPLQVYCLPVDSLGISHPVKLVKIDAEGHELAVIRGMQNLIRRDLPVLIVEANDEEVAGLVESWGYQKEHTAGSPNDVYRPVRQDGTS